MPRLIQCHDCLTVEVIPDVLGKPDPRDPLVDRIVARHRGPLNREQLRHRPPNAPRVREIRDELIPCDQCYGHGGDCWACEGTGKLQREMHRVGKDYDPELGMWSGIYIISADDWVDEEGRRQVLKQVWGDHFGYPDEFYAANDTFRDDAVRCYRKHRSPGSESGPHACIDYRTDSKQLTDSGWKARGEHAGVPREDIYLCHWCPYQSVVTTRMRMKRGDYE